MEKRTYKTKKERMMLVAMAQKIITNDVPDAIPLLWKGQVVSAKDIVRDFYAINKKEEVPDSLPEEIA